MEDLLHREVVPHRLEAVYNKIVAHVLDVNIPQFIKGRGMIVEWIRNSTGRIFSEINQPQSPQTDYSTQRGNSDAGSATIIFVIIAWVALLMAAVGVTRADYLDKKRETEKFVGQERNLIMEKDLENDRKGKISQILKLTRDILS